MGGILHLGTDTIGYVLGIRFLSSNTVEHAGDVPTYCSHLGTFLKHHIGDFLLLFNDKIVVRSRVLSLGIQGHVLLILRTVSAGNVLYRILVWQVSNALFQSTCIVRHVTSGLIFPYLLVEKVS
jgi:hypothetical protein